MKLSRKIRGVQQEGEARRQAGFSMVELVLVTAVAMIFMTMSIMMTRSVMASYRHQNAVASLTMAIQSTRFLAIRNGYPYAIQINPATNSYQVSSQPPGAAFANVGGPVPMAGGSGMVINQATRLEFAPNGTVRATQGALMMTVTYGPAVKTITVSRVGRVSIQ